jgi:PHP family Zn ribbon phosphoesterase
MLVNIDIHSHSAYAGGVGSLSVAEIDSTMPLKGIHVVGTGDCLHPTWKNFLEKNFVNDGTNLFQYKGESSTKFILQTEIVITTKYGKKRKQVHTLFIFPDFSVIEKVCDLFKKWGMKNTIGRPFLRCSTISDLEKKLTKILDQDEFIEMIPAHVMTPLGVFGSNNPINSLEDFFGELTDRIYAVETGLSADPIILGLIPELDKLTLISNSDAHSIKLNRLGREFTTLKLNALNYEEIIQGIRKNKVVRTAEFDPSEGRYFLTGHRGGKSKHKNNEFCVFSPKNTPQSKLCPICGKKLTIGVLERAFELCKIQGEDRQLGFLPKKQDFVHMVPLIEIIASSLGIKSTDSKIVMDKYRKIVEITTTECDLWFFDNNLLAKKLESVVEDKIIRSILDVKKGNFCFYPAGYDGVYGTLLIGEKRDFLDINVIKSKKWQTNLAEF